MLASSGCPSLRKLKRMDRAVLAGSRRAALLLPRSLCIYEVMEEIVVTPMSKEDAEKACGARPSFERCTTARDCTTLA